MVQPFVRAGPEFTKVGTETEVKIPWLTYVIKSSVFMIVDTGCWVIGWLLWWQSRQAQVSFWFWLTREWWGWASRYWAWVVITLILCWIGPSAIAYLYRLFVEQIIKQTPQYTAYPAEYGRWRPFQRQVERVDMFETAVPEQEQQPYAVKGTLKTSNRSELYLEFELESHAAALKWHQFCKAVAYKKKNFSYNEAVKRHRLSDQDWGRIYKAFTAQHWAVAKGRRGTPKLKAVGKHWIKMYADNPPPPLS